MSDAPVPEGTGKTRDADVITFWAAEFAAAENCVTVLLWSPIGMRRIRGAFVSWSTGTVLVAETEAGVATPPESPE